MQTQEANTNGIITDLEQAIRLVKGRVENLNSKVEELTNVTT
jgi:cell division protein FtsL